MCDGFWRVLCPKLVSNAEKQASLFRPVDPDREEKEKRLISGRRAQPARRTGDSADGQWWHKAQAMAHAPGANVALHPLRRTPPRPRPPASQSSCRRESAVAPVVLNGPKRESSVAAGELSLAWQSHRKFNHRQGFCSGVFSRVQMKCSGLRGRTKDEQTAQKVLIQNHRLRTVPQVPVVKKFSARFSKETVGES